MKGKGRKQAAMEFAMVEINLMCDGNHEVAKALMTTPPHPRPGKFQVANADWSDANGVGKISAACMRCGSKPQWRWDRVVAALHESEQEGIPSRSLRP